MLLKLSIYDIPLFVSSLHNSCLFLGAGTVRDFPLLCNQCGEAGHREWQCPKEKLLTFNANVKNTNSLFFQNTIFFSFFSDCLLRMLMVCKTACRMIVCTVASSVGGHVLWLRGEIRAWGTPWAEPTPPPVTSGEVWVLRGWGPPHVGLPPQAERGGGEGDGPGVRELPLRAGGRAEWGWGGCSAHPPPPTLPVRQSGTATWHASRAPSWPAATCVGDAGGQQHESGERNGERGRHRPICKRGECRSPPLAFIIRREGGRLDA